MSRLFANAQGARSLCRSPVRIAQFRFKFVLARRTSARDTAGMKRSKLLVVVVVVVIIGVVAFALNLRKRMRCAGFAGPGVTAAELPSGPSGAGVVRFSHFNLRNFPLDERPQTADLGYSRRTNICDLEEVLAGLGAQVMGFVEVCDTRRFPPILRRAGGERPMRLLFSRGGGRGGQHLAVAWDGDAFELVGGSPEEQKPSFARRALLYLWIAMGWCD